MEGRLAKAEARIIGDTFVISSASFQFHLQDSDHLSFESFRFVCSTGEPLIGYRARGGICQC